MTKVLTADDILNSNDLERVKVDVPEWGGHVYLTVMTGIERDAWEMNLMKKGHDGKPEINWDRLKNLRARMLVSCITDKNGNRLFNAQQIDALGEKSSLVLDRLYDEAQKLNKISEEDIEELEGNLEAVPNGGSGTN